MELVEVTVEKALTVVSMQPFHVVYIQDQGYGWMDASNYDEAMKFAPDRVTLIASFETKALAQKAYAQLPQEWRDIEGLHYADGEWWQTTRLNVPNLDGQVLELFVPADRPVPVFSAPNDLITV